MNHSVPNKEDEADDEWPTEFVSASEGIKYHRESRTGPPRTCALFSSLTWWIHLSVHCLISARDTNESFTWEHEIVTHSQTVQEERWNGFGRHLLGIDGACHLSQNEDLWGLSLLRDIRKQCPPKQKSTKDQNPLVSALNLEWILINYLSLFFPLTFSLSYDHTLACSHLC